MSEGLGARLAENASLPTPSREPMSKTHVHRVDIQFGDCDPAGIVFFPNYLKWMDESSLAFFMACGVPPWRELVKTRGIVGTPLLNIHTRFVKSATYGETLEIHTSIEEWHAKTFKHRHHVMRGETLICEGTEIRAFVHRDAHDHDRLRAMPIPEDIKARCT